MFTEPQSTTIVASRDQLVEAIQSRLGPAEVSYEVSILATIPECLHTSVTQYIESHQGWSQERLMQAALSLFLLRNGVNQPHVNSLYLDSLFGGES